MTHMKGDYISTSSRYGESKPGCFAYIDDTVKDGDLYISTIGVYDEEGKENKIFDFNVGTLSGDPGDVFSLAKETYLSNFSIID
ncbi:hypothetical protein [Klebsiella pneumoniae]|uniref:hypothetical protein n=1 Tax=Klebsiella pneumoniae TaxID=573 RepID=UPI00292CD6CE|nr:hypothetical protein [Klebsiella pneumoniae]